MNQQDCLESQLEAANEALRQLRADLELSEWQIARILEILEEQRSQLNSQATSIARLDRILMQVLSGRIWRTLRAAGDLTKRFLLAGRGGARAAEALAEAPSYLVCDEPKANELKPRSGKFRIRGWCLAEAGVDCVQIAVAALPPIEITPAVARPDIKKAFPDLDKTGHAGFVYDFDSVSLANGRHSIVLRLVSQGKVVQEIKTAINIDHEKGFASDYDRWISQYERRDEELMNLKLSTLQRRPAISIVMPVYNPDPAELTAAIESVLDQSYRNWELCAVDDGSADSEPRKILERFARQDSRIKVISESRRGGISAACNAGLRMAAGEYICFLDHDDTLARHALAYVCEALERCPDADLLYSDEDKIDQQGARYEPFFKPDWSPDLLLSENYICHLLTLRKDLIGRIGGFHSDCDGSQDYDLILRAAEQANRIEHIPKVLYHWRASVGSTAAAPDNKQYALEAARTALQRHCDRAGKQIKVEEGAVAGRWRARYPIPQGTRVSIIIASGGNTEVLGTNLKSLFAKTTYRDFEVVVIDNSKHNAINSFVSRYQAGSDSVRYIDWRNKPFNYSAINNAAAWECQSPVLLFLNDDTYIIAPDWLESMLELAVRPEVGAVGAKLLYPNGKIQHAGVVMGLYDNCGHAFSGLDGAKPHYFDLSDVIRNVSAVTGACLMTRTSVFREAGGFDESAFPIAFNDVDLCLKIGCLGYRILYTPHAVLGHHEAFSKNSTDFRPRPEEVARMRLKWEKVIAADPYYSPNLTRNEEDYSLRTRV